MNELPSNIIPIEQGKEIQIERLKTRIEEKLKELRALLEVLNEKHKLAQKFGDDDEVHMWLGHIIDVEAGIEKGEELSMQADQELFETTKSFLEKKWALEDMDE